MANNKDFDKIGISEGNEGYVRDSEVLLGTVQGNISGVLIPKDINDVDFAGTERALERSQNLEFPKEFLFEGRNFILNKNVFSPIHFKGSSIYIKHLPLNQNDSFLDMGCGCGVIGITALLKYNLDKVVCADINQDAVNNTKENILMHKISGQVEVVQSDVFSGIGSDEKFDLIFRNAPYFDGDFDESNILYRSMYDKNYEHIKRFILDGQEHLKEGGKIMLGFSSDKFPLEHARRLINEIGYDLEIFYEEVDALGFKQEILNVVKLKNSDKDTVSHGVVNMDDSSRDREKSDPKMLKSLKNYRSRLREHIDLPEETRNKIENVAKRIDQSLVIKKEHPDNKNDETMRIEFELNGKHYRFLEIDGGEHSDDEYKIRYNYGYKTKNDVGLEGIKGPLGMWKNKKLERYVQGKIKSGEFGERNNEFMRKSILGNLGKVVGLERECDQLVMLIYLIGLYGVIWGGLYDENSRSCLRCRDGIRGLSYRERKDSYYGPSYDACASLCLVACW